MEKSPFRKLAIKWSILAILPALPITLAGCNDDPIGPGDEEDGGETGCLPKDNENAPCECDWSSEQSWECQCYYSSEWADPAICEDPVSKSSDYVCATDLNGAKSACADVCSSVPGATSYRIHPETAVPCLTNPASMSCTSWDPASEITYYSGGDYYGMDWAFIAGLVSDPEPLWACDDAYFDPVSGYFVVADADSDEFLYELGLRDGDKIVSLNEITISDYNDVALAFAELWGETSFTLEIIRSGNTIELDYELFVTL